MARIILASSDGPKPIELRPFNSVGRHPNNTIQLLDRIVSKEHCIVELRGDGFWLRDLGSLNGTYVNAERVVGERRMAHGDEIAMGSSRAWFDEGQGLLPHQLVARYVGPANGGEGPSSPSNPPGPAPAIPGPPPGRAPVLAMPLVNAAPRSIGTMVIPAFAVEGQNVAGFGRVDLMDERREIGSQMAATAQSFRPFDQVSNNPAQVRADYERLRMSYELSRAIAAERDMTQLLAKVLQAIFKFVRADRGVIFLRSEQGNLEPGASLRRDGSAQPIAVSSTILNHVERERAAVITHDASMDFAASKGKSMILNRITSAIVAPLMHNDHMLGVLWLDSESLAQFREPDLEIVTGIAAQAAMFIENTMLAKKIEEEIVRRERFSRSFSPAIRKKLIDGELEVRKGGQFVSECTVFNSDIRGFTRMSASEPPEVIVEMLNEHFELMVETLFKYDGTLDKFIGDGLMALWGAPVAHPEDPVRAVDCALVQMEMMQQFNLDRQERGLHPLDIGIGIHTGPLVAGYIGSSQVLQYTVIGDTVNISARLCSHAAKGQILVSESTRACIGGRFVLEELAPAQVKGKEHPLRVFNVLGRSTNVSFP